MKNVKKMILPSTAIIVSFYLSLLFLIGIIVGYWGTNKFCKKYIDGGKINPIYLDLGKWELHFHHWLMGISAFFTIWFFGFYNIIPEIILGAIGGMTVHDFYTDKEWHKVLYKK